MSLATWNAPAVAHNAAQNATLTVAGMLAKLKQAEVTKPEFIAFLRSKTPDTMAVLQLVSDGVLTADEAGEFVKGEQKKGPSLYCKVSEKGAVSVYGLQRMPVTLYMEQWARLLGFREQLEGFIRANASKLSVKAK